MLVFYDFHLRFDSEFIKSQHISHHMYCRLDFLKFSEQIYCVRTLNELKFIIEYAEDQTKGK